MPSTRSLLPLAAALITLSACKGATEVCDSSDPLCSPGGGSTPSMSIADATVTEGTGGTTNLNFTVSLSAATSATVTVQYATVAGTATAPDDYAAVSGTLTIASGLTTGQVIVPLVADIVGEAASETFTVNLSSPTNATIADGTAVGTITDDDDCVPISTLSLGQIVSGTLANSDCTWTSATDYFDMYLLSLADSATISVDLTSNAGDFDPYVGLFSLNGSIDEQNDDGGYELNSHQVVSLAAGRYVLYAAAATSGGEMGNYKLSTARIPPTSIFYGSTSVLNAELYRINSSTGASTLVGLIGFDYVGAMAFHPTTKVLYAVGERVIDGVRVLISINRTTGVGTEIGPTGAAAAAGLAFRADGTLFMYGTNHTVYTVNTSTGAASAVGASGYTLTGGNGIAFSAAGTLYHSNQYQTHSLNTSTGAGSTLADTDFPDSCQAVIVVNPTGGRFSGVDRPAGLSQFYGVVKCGAGGTGTPTYFGRMDFTTGYAILIGETGNDDMDGFAIYTP